MTVYYMSFVKDEKFAGACILEAESATHATMLAWAKGCNPGGEILFVEPERIPDQKWFGRLLSLDDLREMSQEVVCDYGLSPEDAKLFNLKGDEI